VNASIARSTFNMMDRFSLRTVAASAGRTRDQPGDPAAPFISHRWLKETNNPRRNFARLLMLAVRFSVRS